MNEHTRVHTLSSIADENRVSRRTVQKWHQAAIAANNGLELGIIESCTRYFSDEERDLLLVHAGEPRKTKARMPEVLPDSYVDPFSGVDQGQPAGEMVPSTYRASDRSALIVQLSSQVQHICTEAALGQQRSFREAVFNANEMGAALGANIAKSMIASAEETKNRMLAAYMASQGMVAAEQQPAQQ